VAAGDVGRQEVRCELDPAELQRQQPREPLDHLGLAEAREPFEQHVAAREQRGDDFVDFRLLAEHDPAKAIDDTSDPGLGVRDALGGRQSAWFIAHRGLLPKYFLTAL
jgi:hypothetical protein